MRAWLQSHFGLSLDEAIGLAALVLALLSLVLAPVRRALHRLGRWLWAMFGVPERRYAAWFIKTYGHYDNPYLDDRVNLDLRRTYVSLFFAGTGSADERIDARDAIGVWPKEAQTVDRNVLIEGEPGSGKSTLLRAYAVGALHRGKGGWSNSASARHEVPFFVALRKLGAELSRPGGTPDLAGYIITEVLVRSAGMSLAAATEFFDDVVQRGRCLVMLDGLDEVTSARYEAVKAAVHRFISDHDPDRPTASARVVVTCRRQNLIDIRDEWVGPVATRAFRLAPLRTSEMNDYLDNLRAKFRSPTGPEDFLAALRSSGTFELHRTPLILAMSVGLFIRKARYEIPHSISQLYATMIAELLDRHRFRGEDASTNFRMKDKYRVLREFAFRAARGSIGFGEFSRSDLLTLTSELAGQLEAVRAESVPAIVDEIIERSGLVTEVSDERYVFAHRSIQEYLVAEELGLSGQDGTDFVLAHAAATEWRQVVLFVTAAADQRVVGPMLTQLATADVALAGQCLNGADAPDEAARPIIDKLARLTTRQGPLIPVLAALLAATGSPRVPVQEYAISVAVRVLAELPRGRALVTLLGGDTAAVTRVIATLAASDAIEIAALVPALAESVPGDAQLVEPLWRSLATPSLPDETAAEIIRLLLGLAIEPDCLAELQRQDPISRPFLDVQLRRRAYPFTKGLPVDSNLVTLLAWAERLGVTPGRSIAYFDAKADGQLATLERDRARTLTLRPYWPTVSLTLAVYAVAVVVTVDILITRPKILLRPYGGWTLLFVAVCSVYLAVGRFLVDKFVNDDHPLELIIEAVGDLIDEDWVFYPLAVLLLGLIPLPISLALAPLLAHHLVLYLVTAVLATSLCLFAPILKWCKRDRSYQIWAPNPYVSVMYENVRNRLWVLPDQLTASPVQPRSATASRLTVS